MKCYTPFNKWNKRGKNPSNPDWLTDKQQVILWESHIRPKPFHSTPPQAKSIHSHISIVSFCFALLSRESIMVSVSVSVSIFAPYFLWVFQIFHSFVKHLSSSAAGLLNLHLHLGDRGARAGQIGLHGARVLGVVIRDSGLDGVFGKHGAVH